MKKRFLQLLLLLSPFTNFGQVIINNVAIIDVRTGIVSRNQFVRIEGNKISSISGKPASTKNAIMIDGTGKFLIPGLWDMHAHFLSRWDRSAPLYLANGVTGARDMANSMSFADIRELKKIVLAKKILGPRFITGGRLLDGPQSRFANVALLISGKERAAIVADSLKQEGIDFYKVYDNLPRDAFYVFIQKGKEYHLAVCGHVPSSISPEEASSAGMKSIEHLKLFLSRNNVPGDSTRRLFQSAMLDLSRKDTFSASEKNRQGLALLSTAFSDHDANEAGKLFARNGTWIVPTMVQTLPGTYGKKEMLKEKNWEYMPASVTTGWRKRLMNDQLVMRFDTSAFVEYQLRCIREFHKAGVQFLTGSDANDGFIGNIPGFSVHQEMELFVQAGLTNLEALQTATLNPALYLEAIDSLGTIEKNKIADLVILSANPLDNIQIQAGSKVSL
jgi:hypothetical protein